MASLENCPECGGGPDDWGDSDALCPACGSRLPEPTPTPVEDLRREAAAKDAEASELYRSMTGREPDSVHVVHDRLPYISDTPTTTHTANEIEVVRRETPLEDLGRLGPRWPGEGTQDWLVLTALMQAPRGAWVTDFGSELPHPGDALRRVVGRLRQMDWPIQSASRHDRSAKGYRIDPARRKQPPANT